jgi:hypothetical protein
MSKLKIGKKGKMIEADFKMKGFLKLFLILNI